MVSGITPAPAPMLFPYDVVVGRPRCRMMQNDVLEPMLRHEEDDYRIQNHQQNQQVDQFVSFNHVFDIKLLRSVDLQKLLGISE